jgi:hypothetical protein
MSTKRTSVTKEKEEENFDVFSRTLRRIMETPAKDRGPASKAIMSGFQVYYEMIAAQAKLENTTTR